MSNTCPACGSPATGRFCSECGASLANPVECRQCGNEIPTGGRFCNMCGTPVAKSKAAAGMGATATVDSGDDASPSRAGSLAAAGAAALVLIVALFYVVPRLGSNDPVTAAPVAGNAPFAGGAAAGDPSAVDLSSMTPEEAANRLFNRVMMSVAEEDSAAARQFAPMAIMAYEAVPEKDLDAYYHMTLLHLVNNDPAGARNVATIMIEDVPTHLFGLYTAGQAEQALGNAEASRDFYERFLASYDAELATGRIEYVEHEAVLPAMRDNARRALGEEP